VKGFKDSQGDAAKKMVVLEQSNVTIPKFAVQAIKKAADIGWKPAASIKNLELGLLLPGIKINTSPSDFYPVEQMQLAKFDGERWVLFGELIDASEVGAR